MGVAGFVLGLLSLIGCWFGIFPFGWIIVAMGLLGLLFSAIGIGVANSHHEKAGLAVAGLVLSIIGMVSGAFFFLFCGVFYAAALSYVTGSTGFFNNLSLAIATWLIAQFHLVAH